MTSVTELDHKLQTRAHPIHDDRIVVTPAAPDADPVERLRAELAGMQVRGVPMYRVAQITRGRIVAALDLLDDVRTYDEIRAKPTIPTAVLELARDLFCARAAEQECFLELAARRPSMTPSHIGARSVQRGRAALRNSYSVRTRNRPSMLLSSYAVTAISKGSGSTSARTCPTKAPTLTTAQSRSTPYERAGRTSRS